MLHALQAGTRCCISLERCGFGQGPSEHVEQACSTQPGGEYSLQLDNPRERSIAQILVMRASQGGVVTEKQREELQEDAMALLEGPSMVNTRLGTASYLQEPDEWQPGEEFDGGGRLEGTGQPARDEVPLLRNAARATLVKAPQSRVEPSTPQQLQSVHEELNQLERLL